MRLATILPSSSVEPVAVAAAPDGSWIELAGLTGRPAVRLEETLPWFVTHGLHTAERSAAWRGPRYRESEFNFLPPVVRPPAFRDFCAFEQPLKAVSRRRGLEVPQAWYEIPLFHFSNHNALVGSGHPVAAPAGCQELDFELGLGVVIGRGGRDIPPEKAWDHVAGFTIVNDFSARDLQRKEVALGFGPAKAKDFATAVGPWITTRDAFASRIDGERLSLEMRARVNGREHSRGNVSSLHHPIPRLIAQASRDSELYPGDLIGTGPVGTGCILELGPEAAGGWLKPGDYVELEVENLGILGTPIVARTRTGG